MATDPVQDLIELGKKTRELNRRKAAKIRAKRKAEGQRQLTVWVSDSEAESIRQFLKYLRAKTTPWRMQLFHDGRWVKTFGGNEMNENSGALKDRG